MVLLIVGLFAGSAYLVLISSMFFMLFYGVGLGACFFAYLPEILPPIGNALVLSFRWLFLSV
jgi:hypothetical protein